ncbi:MAG: formimidoylglutamate deiminase [Candidatus Baltobacteraceae bacterium]
MDESPAATYHAALAFLPTGWQQDVIFDVAANGDFTSVRSGAAPGSAIRLHGPVLPGMPNVHSHAFQRAFAGRAERRSAGARDSFWTWRETMYAVAERLDPEQFEAIATGVYLEMLRAGYTSVGEFHYMHRDPNGAWYARHSELAQRVLGAAQRTGIALTLLPVLYTYAGFGARAPDRRQHRFILSTDEYLGLWDELASLFAGVDDVRLGTAPHSLRAVAPAQLAAVVAHVRSCDARAPIHIHVAEQEREVADSLAGLGARPVRWLLANAAVDERWCLVHATHLDDAEVASLAASGAIAGLCPTTEANLGDGLFPLQAYLAQGGRLGIGSDSQVTVDVREELRWLEYGQRLATQRRIIACDDSIASVGEYLYRTSTTGGTLGLDRNAGELAPGKRADFVVLDGEALAGGAEDTPTLLDRYLFATSRPAVRDVVVGGRWVIREGHHRAEEAIELAYRHTLRELF